MVVLLNPFRKITWESLTNLLVIGGHQYRLTNGNSFTKDGTAQVLIQRHFQKE